MAKRKKQNNELDAILEQLKRSYGADVDTELEDSLLEDEESDEDAELSSILAKIFSDMDENAGEDNSITDTDSEVGGNTETETDTDIPVIVEATDSGSDIQESTVNQRAIEETTPSIEDQRDEILVPTVTNQDTEDVFVQEICETVETDTELSKEEQEVDNVLSAMLRGSLSKAETSNENTYETHTIKDSIQPSSENELENVKVDTFESISKSEDILGTDYNDAVIATESTDADIDSTEFIDGNSDNTSDITEFDLHTTDYELADDSVFYDEEYEQEPEIEEPTPHIVLNADEYTSDPLQLSLSDLKLLKFDDDISEAPALTTVKEESDNHRPVDAITLDSGDVSLLMKFGYGEEVNTQLGTDKARHAFFDKEKDFSPDPDKIPFGYTGKEFSDRSQSNAIRQKYKSDRFNLFVMLIALSSFTLVSFIAGLLFEFSADRLDIYLPMMAFDLLLVAISALICGKRVISGAIAISRFEANSYSTLLIIGSEYLIYNVLSSVIYMTDPILMHTSFCWISGSCILAYFAAIALCDLITCDKEYKTFELMSSSDAVYTAEKLTLTKHSDDISTSDGYSSTAQGAYRVRKASMIGGYFKKTSQHAIKTISPIYMIGITPSIALALSCCTSILSENAILGIHTFMMISVLCMPLCCICLSAANELLTSTRHKNNGFAFIGCDSEDEFALASLMVFDDTDAIEITSYKEINPGKNSGDIQDKLIIAYNVLKTLGGPLGEIVPDKYISKEGHELIINSISDNGINIYFDSATNILIGDRQYMLSYNLKVKTDVNLTTATKGSDRSVLYMAFDGKPQLGFVLTGKIRPEFTKITSILDACNVSISVESYEPEVNDLYFEQNKTSDYSIITVHRPTRYQEKSNASVYDGTVIAKDTVSLSKAISESKTAPGRKQRIKNSNLISLAIGILLSVLISLVMCIDTPIIALDFLREHPSVALYISIVLSAIPSIIYTVKEYLRK